MQRRTSMKSTYNMNPDRKNSPEESIEIKTATDDTPFKLANPLVICMGTFGLLFLNRRTSKLSRITRGYSVFVLLLMWMRFLQLFFSYRDEHFGWFNVTVHLQNLHSCLSFMAMYKACNKENRFLQFLLKWSSLLRTNRGISPHETSPSTPNYERGLKRRLNLSLVLAWTVLILTMVTHAVLLFNFTIVDFIIAPVLPSQSFAMPMKAMVIFVDVYITASWAFTLSLFIMISAVIYQEFKIFHDDLRKAIFADEHVLEIEWFRRRHEDICDMVDSADDILSVFSAASISICTIEAMLSLYSAVSSAGVLTDPFLLASHCLWMLSMLLYIVFIAYGGGYLNHIAHAPLKTIQRVRVKEATPEFSLQLTIFLNKLSGEPIGLTAFGLFVIDKPTILTIAGAFITYFIVLIQFHQANNPAESQQFNCTDFITNTTAK